MWLRDTGMVAIFESVVEFISQAKYILFQQQRIVYYESGPKTAD